MTEPDPEPDLVGALCERCDTLLQGPVGASRHQDQEVCIQRLKAALFQAESKYSLEADAHTETRAALGKAEAVDDPQFDNTPGAHPAFWRGQDDGVMGTCAVLARVLHGDAEGTCREPIENVRQRIATLKADRDRLLAEIEGVLARYERDEIEADEVVEALRSTRAALGEEER